MTSDIKMLPLPEWMSTFIVPDEGKEVGCDHRLSALMKDYARAVAEHNVAAKDAEIEALRGEVDRRTERVIVHRGQALACSESAHAAFTAEKARAERLAEALRHLRNHTSVNSHQIELIDAALRDHDQEGKDG